MDIEKIKNATKEQSHLDKLIRLVDSIAIIEYNGKDINGCKALCEYIKEQDLSIDIVKRVVLLGRRNRELGIIPIRHELKVAASRCRSKSTSIDCSIAGGIRDPCIVTDF